MSKPKRMSVRKAKAVANMFGKTLMPNLNGSVLWNTASLSILAPQKSLNESFRLSQDIEEARKILRREERKKARRHGKASARRGS